jgi:hypothetical protein
MNRRITEEEKENKETSQQKKKEKIKQNWDLAFQLHSRDTERGIHGPVLVTEVPMRRVTFEAFRTMVKGARCGKGQEWNSLNLTV